MFYFLLALVLSIIFTLLIRQVALKFGFVDRPDGDRKIHQKPVALLGGTAIFLSFLLVAGYLLYWHPLYDIDIFAGKMFWVFVGGLILIILGALDDKFNLPVKWRLVVTALVAIIVVAGGVGLQKITNPFGGIIEINLWLLADLLVFLWLFGMMYTVKISDGLDGLATGICFIGAMMIYFLTTATKYYQPNVALLSLVFAGACLGVLIFNFYPAKIFLGEGGGLFLGLMLGVLAVIAGGKVATALLVMAIPILDLGRVIYLRWRYGRSVWQGDREHLHFRLLDAGLSHPQTVLLLYAVAALFGATTLFLQSSQKLIALMFLFLVMIAVTFWLGKSRKKA